MVIVRQATPDRHAWLIERLEITPTSDLRCIEAVNERGEIYGMMAFDNWRPKSAEMHFWFERPILCGKALLKPVFAYAFGLAKLDYLYGITPVSERPKALEMAKKVGFKEVYRMKDGWDTGSDLVFSVMHKSDCRFYREGNEA